MIVSHPLTIPWYLFFKSVNQSEPSLCYTISPTSGFVKNCSKRVTDRLQGEHPTACMQLCSCLLMGLLSRTWKCSINNNLKKPNLLSCSTGNTAETKAKSDAFPCGEDLYPRVGKWMYIMWLCEQSFVPTRWLILVHIYLWPVMSSIWKQL